MAIETRNYNMAQFKSLYTWSEIQPVVLPYDRSVTKQNLRINMNNQGVVTFILGWDKDMVIVYKDPANRKMHPCRKAIDGEVAAATSLFDTEVVLAAGDIKGHEREIVKQRRLRLSMMLAGLGRPDIVGAMRRIGDFLRTDTRSINRN